MGVGKGVERRVTDKTLRHAAVGRVVRDPSGRDGHLHGIIIVRSKLVVTLLTGN